MTLPNYINASTAPTPTIQLLSGSDALVFRSDTKLGLSDTTGRVGYIGQGGLAMYKPYYVFGGGIAGSDNPDAAGQNNQISFNNTTSEYAIFQSKGYNQNGYQIFADTSNGTPKKIMNWLLSADGNTGYLNCYYAPVGSYGLVRKMDLSTNTVTSTNTYSATGTEGTDDYNVVASNHNIHGQCEFDGRTTTGRGFVLQGSTTSQPTNTSAVCLELYHPLNGAAAQLLYRGHTTGDDACVQTKSSVTSLVNTQVNAATANLDTLPSNWQYYNHNTPDTSSQLTGYWTLQWAADSKTAIVIIKATNDSTNITNGTYVSVIPTAIRPAATVVVRVASRDGMTIGDAAISPTNGYIIIRNVGGPGNTRLEGQLIYSLHSA